MKDRIMTMDTSEFDLDKYLRASKRVDLSTVEWARIREHPVTTAEARCLTYMMDIETHTVVFLRDLLATRASFDPEVTAFLSCWVYEELWHGEAFSRFLGEAGYRVAPTFEDVSGDDPFPTRVDRNQWVRQKFGTKGYVSHIGTLLGSALFRDSVAVHMTWGAVNELGTLTGYHRIIAKTEHPVLIQLLQAVIKDERRHFAFYRAQARMRLARSRQGRTITRWALEHLWAPVGTGVRGASGLGGQPLPHGRAGGSGDPARPTARDGLSDQSRGRTLVPSGVSMTSRSITWSSSRSSSERA